MRYSSSIGGVGGASEISAVVGARGVREAREVGMRGMWGELERSGALGFDLRFLLGVVSSFLC